ncbi:MAG TPA: PhzF family phenazine biosynthesis protein [Tepidisphaeraceae bacterium]|nr:PhzF family phenazine biosynthesis protein [Tepidisphaeraceae bacterium]
MPTPYYIVDAFADRPFAGNPAAVVLLDVWPASDAWLRNVAAEMNLSETAFLVAVDKGYDLRWFTPKSEVDLCGHATIASAVVLGRLGNLADGARVDFFTRSGALGARRQGGRIELDFPSLGADPCTPPAGLVEALGVPAAAVTYAGRSKFDYVVEVRNAADVRALSPDFARLAKVECRGVIVTALSDDPQYDFVSRFFAPAVGIDEDPVTGSAHCRLGPHWGERLGKTRLVGYQASARGGVVHVEVRGDRVTLGGDGVIVASGVLEV